MEVGTDFLSLGSKITADGDCSHEIRRQLLPGRKSMTPIGETAKETHMLRADFWTLVGEGEGGMM